MLGQDKRVTSRAREVTVALREVMKHGSCGCFVVSRSWWRSFECRRTCRRSSGQGVVRVPIARVPLAVIPILGLRVNASSSAPWLAPDRHGKPHAGGVGGGLLGPQAAALVGARGLRVACGPPSWRLGHTRPGRYLVGIAELWLAALLRGAGRPTARSALGREPSRLRRSTG
jgi:hypothetical protein